MARTGRVEDFCAWALALAVVASAGVAAAQPDPEPAGDAGGEIDMAPDPEPEAAAPDGAEPAIDPETAKADARKLLDGGDGFLKKGDQLVRRRKAAEAAAQYERALAAYQKAYELVPNPKILFPIAIAEEKLARWPQAARDFRRFLREVPEADPKLRADADKRLEAAKVNLGVLALVITPDAAQVSLDGAVVGTSPLLDPLYLAGGDYTLSVAADGYQPLEQPLTIEVGSESERSFEMVPIPIIVDTPKPRPLPPPPVVLPPAPNKLPLVLAGGLAIGLAAGATTVGLLAVGEHSTFADTSLPFPEREDARVAGKRLALLTDGLIIGTVVAAAVTSYYYVKVYRPKARSRAAKEREQRTQFDEFASAPKFMVAPWVQPSAGGLILTGSL